MSKSIPLSTNAVGNYLLSSTGNVLHSRGRFGDSPRFDNVTLYDYHKEVSRKPAHHPGDHHSFYNYNRSGGKVTADDLVISHHYDGGLRDDGEHANWDFTREESITQEYTPFSYRPDMPESGNSRSMSITKALNDLRKNSAQIGADVGESHKTAQSFSLLVARAARIVLYLRQKDWRNVMNQLGLTRRGARRGRQLADDWLQYQYGWKPLIGSIYDTAAILQNQVPKDNYIRGRGNGKWEDSLSFRNGVHEWTIDMSGRHRTVIIAQAVCPGIQTAENLGLLNPVSIAWELVPFSFLVDWFIPIGKALEALTAPLGLRFVGGYTNDKHSWTLSGHRDTEAPWPYGYELINPGHYSEENFGFERTAFSTFPMPELYAASNPYRSTRALNAIALLRQL
jgi:hypothetical protein